MPLNKETETKTEKNAILAMIIISNHNGIVTKLFTLTMIF